MSNLKHTALPWRKDFGGTFGHIKSIGDCGFTTGGVRKTPTVVRYDMPECVIPLDEQEANAELIVTAVNYHIKLTETLRELLSRVENDTDAKDWFLSEQGKARALLKELESN